MIRSRTLLLVVTVVTVVAGFLLGSYGCSAAKDASPPRGKIIGVVE